MTYTREEIINRLNDFVMGWEKPKSVTADFWKAVIQALSQEPGDLLIIKSDIFIHQDERRKWMESIKQEKENGVIILPPYFEPLLVPNDIEIKMEQEPCDDAVSREAFITRYREWMKSEYGKIPDDDTLAIRVIKSLPSVTQKSGKWIWSDEIDRYVCDKCGQSDGKDKEMVESGEYPLSNYCHNCGAKMVEPQESKDIGSEAALIIHEEIINKYK